MVHSSVHRVKLSGPVDPILSKLPLEYFAVCQRECSEAGANIIHEAAFVMGPTISDLREILIVEGVVHGLWRIVPKLSHSIKHVAFPVALVGQVPVLVV